jgi:DNA-binding NarL/FixJ family response regulator
MARPIRVLAVDHNRILSEGIGVLIGMEPGMELVGFAREADTAVSLFREQHPDVTLMDLDLPSGSGLDAILRIREIDANAWIIGLITDECDESCAQAVAAGVSTLLAKDLIGRMLVPIIRRESVIGTQTAASRALKPGA